MKRLLLAALSLVLCGFLAAESITPVMAQDAPVITAKKTTKKKKKKKKSKKKKPKKATKKKDTTPKTPEEEIAKIISDSYHLKSDIKDPKIEYDGVGTYYVTYDQDLSLFTTSMVSQVISDYVDVCRSAYTNYNDINSIEFDVTTEMSDGSHTTVIMFRSEKDTFMQVDLTDFLSYPHYWDTFSQYCSNAWMYQSLKDKVKLDSLTYTN